MNDVINATLQSYKNHLIARLRNLFREHCENTSSLSLMEEQIREHDRKHPQIAVPSLFPDGTRYYWREETEAMIVFEEKPKVRTVLFYNDPVRKWRLAFPYIVHIAAYKKLTDNHGDFWRPTQVRVYCATSSLKSLDDFVYISNLPNIDQSGRACISHHATPLTLNVSEIFLAWINFFWSSSFNEEWDANFRNYKQHDRRLVSLPAWEEATREDPLFVLKVDWKGKISLQEEIKKAWTTLPSANFVYNHWKEGCHQLINDWYTKAVTVPDPQTTALDLELLSVLAEELKKQEELRKLEDIRRYRNLAGQY